MFDTNSLQVLSAPPDGFEYSVDILIIGAGACGLTAALAAAEQGASTLILERDATPSGSTAMSYGAICAAGSGPQAAAGIADTPEALVEDLTVNTQGQLDRELAQAVADISGETIDWLMASHNIELTFEAAWTGFGHRAPRLVAPDNRSGVKLMAMLQNAVSRQEVTVVTNARWDRVYRDDAGDVLGVGAVRPDGSVEQVGCRALIIATCGFGANAEMLAEFIPEITGARYYGHEGNDGAGIQLGRLLGANVEYMSAYQSLGALAVPHNLVIPHVILIGGGIQINVRGERFQNELDNISGQALTILEQPEAQCWMVTNEQLHQDALGRFEEYRQAEALGAVKRGEDARDLARNIGVSEERLESEVAATLAHVTERGTDRFGRDFSGASPLSGPLYAVRVTGALFHTQGGLSVNRHAQLINGEGAVLGNIYAGGGAAMSVAGTGNAGYMPGVGLMMAVNLGRIAGAHAAAHYSK